MYWLRRYISRKKPEPLFICIFCTEKYTEDMKVRHEFNCQARAILDLEFVSIFRLLDQIPVKNG